jgi:hypothetical protein
MGRMVVSLARLQESKEIGFDNLEHIRRRHEILRPGQTRPHDQLSRRQSEKDAGTVEKGRRLVDRKTEDSEFGKFGWIKDSEGNRIELWEPPKMRRKS